MKYFKRYYLVFILLIYVALWYIIHPILGYMLDSDGVAYLTIARRVAEGDYLRSINGLWSPLNSWLLVPFIQKGYEAFIISKYLNLLIGAILIVQSYLLFKRFSSSFFYISLFSACLAVAMVYFTFFQLYGDLLQIIFVLAYLHILLFKIKASPMLYSMICGIIMGLGFYAKAYSFPFFVLHFSVIHFYWYLVGTENKTRIVKNIILGTLTTILVVLPWTLALHKKYDVWSITGLAGKLNMSWNINSAKTFQDSIQLLIPPTYDDSPSFWEDPYLSQGELSNPLSSSTHFIKWGARVVHTVLVYTQCMNEISPFGLAILFIAVWYFFFRNINIDEDSSLIHVIILTALLLPVGFLAMHIETRYIWLNVILLMLITIKLLEKSSWKRSVLKNIAVVIVALSFITYPIYAVEQLKYKNKDLFDMAATFREFGIKGRFTSNISEEGRMWVVAYLTHNSYYTIERTEFSEKELLKEMKKYQVDYFVLEINKLTQSLNLSPDRWEKIIDSNQIQVYKLVL